MPMIEAYVRPKSIEEAYTLLQGNKDAVLFGGGAFLRLSSREIPLAIDLSGAGLDFIREKGEFIEIGAMTTLGQMERSELLQSELDGILPKTVAHITGVQMRNIITVGGTVSGRYGFSELLTCLSILDCKVKLYKSGEWPLQEYLTSKNKDDIVEKIMLRKENLKASYQPFRVTHGSLPILAVAVSRMGSAYRIAAGARPGPARPAEKTMALLNSGLTDIERAAEQASTELDFSGDRKASAEYRRELCRVLVKRALAEVAG